ncbi:MAG: DMT family transporter [Bacteroidota bacterium]|jgi:drug/metabolite transporter (DMT)-like permease|nr:DMT family transporter [Sphingobacteriales bacterium]
MSIRLKVHLSLFIVSLIYAGTFTIAKEVMPAHVKPSAFILLRVSVAALCIFIFHSVTIKERISEWTDIKKLFISAMFGVAFNMLLFFKGLSITTPINGAVLMMNTPIFVVVFAAFLLKEKLSIIKISGILIAAAGAIMLMGGSKFNFSTETVLGDILVSLNAIIYAFYLVYAKSLMKKYHPLTVTLWSFFFGLFLVMPFGASDFMNIQWATFTPSIWAAIAFVTVGSTFITYVLNAYALRHASSSLVGSYIYLQPVLAVFIALISGKDALTWVKALDILIIFVGVLLVNQRQDKEV